MFRFTIRDVLWLMVVVALGVGWWVDHRQNIAMRREFDGHTKIVDWYKQIFGEVRDAYNKEGREIIVLSSGHVHIFPLPAEVPPDPFAAP